MLEPPDLKAIYFLPVTVSSSILALGSINPLQNSNFAFKGIKGENKLKLNFLGFILSILSFNKSFFICNNLFLEDFYGKE